MAQGSFLCQDVLGSRSEPLNLFNWISLKYARFAPRSWGGVD